MISKELLSQIENLDIFSVEFLDKENIIHICGNYKDTEIHTEYSINIYELAFKCKAWAHSNGYWLSVRLYEPNGFNIVVFSHIHSQLQKDLKEINDKTEPEAVFKACQWILEQKGIK